MKVLLVGQLPKEVGGNYTTGIANVVYELSKQRIVEVKLFTYATNMKSSVANSLSNYPNEYMGYKYLVFSIITDIILHPIRTLKEWRNYKKSGNNPLRFAFYKANFSRVIKNVNPDIIHYNGCGINALYFANSSKVPVIYTCHGVFERFVDPESHAKLYADYLTGLTNETLWEIHNYYCVTDDRKIRIIPNGVDCKKFYFSIIERNNLREEMGVSNNTKVFITVASVQERKGQFAFIELVEKLNLDYQYWIVGSGSDVNKIDNYCLEHNIQSKVKLLGYKNSDELYKYYSAADIYAHSSIMEGQALCEIEAFATGLRVLVRNLIKGTIADDELSSGDYLFVDFENPNIFAINEWINKENIVPRMSRNNLDWSNVSFKYVKFYKEIMDGLYKSF